MTEGFSAGEGYSDVVGFVVADLWGVHLVESDKLCATAGLHKVMGGQSTAVEQAGTKQLELVLWHKVVGRGWAGLGRQEAVVEKVGRMVFSRSSGN